MKAAPLALYSRAGQNTSFSLCDMVRNRMSNDDNITHRSITCEKIRYMHLIGEGNCRVKLLHDSRGSHHCTLVYRPGSHSVIQYSRPDCFKIANIIFVVNEEAREHQYIRVGGVLTTQSRVSSKSKCVCCNH